MISINDNEKVNILENKLLKLESCDSVVNHTVENTIIDEFLESQF